MPLYTSILYIYIYIYIYIYSCVSTAQVKSLLPSEADKSDGGVSALVTGLYFRNDLGGVLCRPVSILTIRFDHPF